MFIALQNELGPSAVNWLIVAAAGLLFIAGAKLLPHLLRRWRGKDGHPLF